MSETILSLGRKGLEFADFLRECGRLIVGFVYWLLVAPFRGFRLRIGETARQMVRVGVNSIPIVFLVNFFVGVTLAITVADILRTFGVTEYTGSVMGVGFWRELGPLLTGIIMAGYVGASLAAEIGTMKVGEELMALEAAALNPIRFLIRFLAVPRLLAVLIMVPIATLLATAFGIYGGYLVCVGLLDLTPALFFDKMLEPMVVKDLWVGGLKSMLFGLIVGVVGIAQGLQVRGGAEGVGRATTNSVVYSIILIIVMDTILTIVLYF
ncbi:MAG: MlaE family ABC transporter permease [Planctomycetota bacterium]|jgi:phospholipid/cholesterol/gamma-HCH transport system permease protein